MRQRPLRGGCAGGLYRCFRHPASRPSGVYADKSWAKFWLISPGHTFLLNYDMVHRDEEKARCY
jgi:hypothetical protein